MFMIKRFNPAGLPAGIRISMERKFAGRESNSFRTIKSVALHVGVKPQIAGRYLRHLKERGLIPRESAFWKK